MTGWERGLSNGYVVVAILRETQTTGRQVTYPRVTGPFETRTKAQTRAVSVRRQAKRALADHRSVELLSVNVAPVWEELSS